MPVPRKRQISLADTPYYHCVSRCVRRAFLCGKDKFTGKCYEHRRQWVEDRLIFLSTIFCIDVCAFAVMSNHTHVVLHINKVQALQLSDTEVLTRWHKLHNPSLLAQQFIQNGFTSLKNVELATLASTIAIYRQRLFDISWFMRELNEPIARKANKEDQCTGHFWEGRFKSQALLDEQALAACMVYVDLNPVRANISDTPETSDHTSIKIRIEAAIKGEQPKSLMCFSANSQEVSSVCLPFSLTAYIGLVNYSSGLHKSQQNINLSRFNLSKLRLDESTWLQQSHYFEEFYSVAAGNYQSLLKFKKHTKRKRMLGLNST